MMKIVLVEDEPAAMRHLRSIIELKCSGFEVVDTAENGVEGLEKIRKLKPDVVITDIRMGGMDGIELVRHIRKEFPFIYSVIVSGYQDFEYTKGAIKSRVVDYLLKPVNVSQMNLLLGSLRKKLEEDYYKKRVELLVQALNGVMPVDWQRDKYLPFHWYTAAIVRENGLPSRFSSKHDAVINDPAMHGYSLSNVAGDKDIWILPGRDEFEKVFIHTSEIANGSNFEGFIDQVAQKLTCGYHTKVFSSEPFGLPGCKKVISQLYRVMDHNIVIGLSQTIHQSQDSGFAKEDWAVLDGTIGNKIDYFVSNGLYDELKHELTTLFTQWKKEKRTQLWVENTLRQIFQHIEKQSASKQGKESCDVEFMLDAALCYSTTFDQLMDRIWGIVEKILQHSDRRSYKIDTPAFFRSVEQYIYQNLSEPLSLQTVCTSFGISQTYLSRLFRKYKSMSFNEYLTKARIDEAKRLITENPDIPLKDIASIVGYNDPFYFSRVFRSVTGIPPSKYQLEYSSQEP